MFERHDIELAGRLVQYALRGDRPRVDSEYRRSLDRYRADQAFSDLVDTIATSLGLYVLGATAAGLVLSGDQDGPFRVTVDNSGLPIRDAHRLVDRLCFGLVVVAVAAYGYPDGQALTETTSPTVRHQDLERFIDGHATQIASTERDDSDDVDRSTADAAARWLELPEIDETERGQLRKGCRRWYVDETLKWLAAQGRARREPALSDARGDVYQLTDRFRLGVSEVVDTVAFGVFASGRRDGYDRPTDASVAVTVSAAGED